LYDLELVVSNSINNAEEEEWIIQVFLMIRYES